MSAFFLKRESTSLCVATTGICENPASWPKEDQKHTKKDIKSQLIEGVIVDGAIVEGVIVELDALTVSSTKVSSLSVTALTVSAFSNLQGLTMCHDHFGSGSQTLSVRRPLQYMRQCRP